MLLSLVGALIGCGNSGKPTHDWVEKTDDGFMITDNGASVLGITDEDDKEIEGFLELSFIFHKGKVSDFTANDASSNVALFRSIYVMFAKSVFEGDSPSNDGIYAKETFDTALDLKPETVCTKMVEATDIISGDGATTAASIVTATTEALKLLIAAILVIFWCIQFMTQVIQERFTMESFLKGMLFLIIGIIIVENAVEFASMIIQLGNEIFSKIMTSVASSTADPDGFMGQYKTYVFDVADNGVIYVGLCASIVSNGIGGTIYWFDYGSALGMFLLILPFLGQVICAYQIVSQMFTRMLELILRIAFSPIPLSFGATQGFGPSSMNFLKSTLACALQPSLIIVACKSFDLLLQALLDAFGANTGLVQSPVGGIMIFIGYIILSGFIGQTKQLSNEIIAR